MKTSVVESCSNEKDQGLKLFANKETAHMLSIQMVNTLVEVNQLQMQSAEVVRWLCEACQDVKVFFLLLTGFSWVFWVKLKTKPVIATGKDYNMLRSVCTSEACCIETVGKACPRLKVDLILQQRWSSRLSYRVCAHKELKKKICKIQLRCAFSPCRDWNDANCQELVSWSNVKRESHMASFKPQDVFSHI